MNEIKGKLVITIMNKDKKMDSGKTVSVTKDCSKTEYADKLSIKKIRVSTSQHPEMEICDFEKNEADGRIVLRAHNEDIHLETSICSENGITALKVSASLLKRENHSGFPDCFCRDKSIEILFPLSQEGSFLSVYQHKAWWTRPAFGSMLHEVPDRTQLLIRKAGEIYEVFLAVCLDGLRADLIGCEDGIRVRLSTLRDNVKNIEGLTMMYGIGPDPYEILSRCMHWAKELSHNAFRTLDEKKRPDFMDGIGWCTWDSLGQDVSEQAIFDKMEEFRRLKIPICYVLIDDGWSWVNRQTLKLKGLDADPQRFPEGLAGTVRTLKEVYHVKHVGVWQAFKGYWYGIEYGSPAHLQTKQFLMKYADGELTVRPTPEAAFGFWNLWHKSLRKAGIDFVKVDGQGSVPTMLRGDCPDDDAMKNLYTGLEASVFLNFAGNLINCMGMAPENVWNRNSSTLSRSSDDYTPKAEGSIVEHLLQNCYNNVWQGDLYLGDWDMFWSDHAENVYSALLRILSGGPVYVSDPLGKTDKKVIDSLIGSDKRLFCCEAAARPTLDCLTQDPLRTGGVLKIFNLCGSNGYLGCFTWDVSGNEAVSTLHWQDISACLPMPLAQNGHSSCFKKPEAWLVCDQKGNTLGICDKTTPFVIHMPGRSARLLKLVPQE